ncbi:MAG: nitrate ABC transporter permease [Hyphomonadaceae bacterium]
MTLAAERKANLKAQTSMAPASSAHPQAEIVPLPRRTPSALRGAGDAIVAGAGVIVPPIFMTAAVLIVWQVLCSDPYSLFPSPLSMWEQSRELITDPFFKRDGLDQGLFWHVLTSLQRVAVGFTVAAFVGVLVGVIIGASTLAHRAVDPLFQILRTVPPLAWLPISLAIFREAQPSALFVIFITAIWPVIINTAVGIRNLPADYLNIGRVLRFNAFEMFFRIMAPAATPYIFTGLRIGVGMSWLAIVASEMLLGGVGIGFFIWDQYNASRISDIVVALIWVGVVGFILDRFVALLGHLASRGAAAS